MAPAGRQRKARTPRGLRLERPNNAIWRIVIVRLRRDDRTRRYPARRTTEGLSKREIVRCLKRYVARVVYAALIAAEPERLLIGA